MKVALAAMILFASTAALADALPAKVTPDRVQLGQPFVEEIAVPHGKGETVSLRAPASLGDFSLLSVERHEDKGATVLRARLALYRLGAHTLPPLSSSSTSAACATTRCCWHARRCSRCAPAPSRCRRSRSPPTPAGSAAAIT